MSELRNDVHSLAKYHRFSIFSMIFRRNPNMLVDDTQFPLVWMRADTSDTPASPFASLETLLAREESFVLLDNLAHEEHEDTPEERKQLALWMKSHKAALRTFIKAAIHIEPDADKQAAARAFSPTYEKFWGYPLRVVASTEEALALARELLSGSGAERQEP
jgi:hypothetical protein